MRAFALPEWLRLLSDLVGHDSEGEENSSEEENNNEEENSEEEEDGEEEEENNSSGGDVSGLKKALDAERKAKKALEKEARKLRREADERASKEKSDVEQAAERADKAEKAASALAARLKANAVDTLIIKLASKHKFRDVDDALRLLDRDDIEIEQDEDDPADIEIDETSVDQALKALATKKPHLIIADGTDSPSGSRFGGGKGGKGGQDATEEELKRKYPALGR